MATTFRQPLARFEFIEVDDTLTFRTHTTYRRPTEAEMKARRAAARAEWNATHSKSKQRGPSDYFYLASEYDYVPIDDPAQWHYPSAKVVEKHGEGWLVTARDHKGEQVVVDRENFWGLRKAPGKGGNVPTFEPDDTVVQCQVCGLGRRGWIANAGRVPHHGYERPGWGYQTDSCAGAMALPYSVLQDPKGNVKMLGRDVLPAVIASYDAKIAATEAYVADVEASRVELPSPDLFELTSGLARGRNADDPRYQPIPPSDERYRQRRKDVLSEKRGELSRLRFGRDIEQARFDAWKPGGDGVLTAPTPRA